MAKEVKSGLGKDAAMIMMLGCGIYLGFIIGESTQRTKSAKDERLSRIEKEVFKGSRSLFDPNDIPPMPVRIVKEES